MAKLSPAQATLAALESGAPVPFPDDVTARARSLLTTEAPSTAEVEALPEPLALALVEHALRQRRSGLLSSLAASGRKELAKAAKRGLYALRSSGVAVPEAVRTQAAAAAAGNAGTGAASADEDLPALISGLTGDGERALVVVRPVRGGLELAQAVLSDETGVVSLMLADTSRGAWRRQLKELRAAQAPPAFEVDLGRAKAELALAAGRNLSSRTPFPKGLSGLLTQLDVRPDETPAPLPQPEPEDERRVTSGQALHEQPEIRGWLPSEPVLRELTKRMDALVDSPLALSDQQRTDQLLQTFRTAAMEYFTPAMKQLYARRLWAMAELFERTGREGPAQVARAEARRLFHDAPGPFSRFAEFLFEKVLLLTAMRGEEADAPPGTTPQGSAGTATRGHKTPGGIIQP